jgi:hypothetical protein
MFSDGRSNVAREAFVDAYMNYLHFSLDVSHTDAPKIFITMLYNDFTTEQKAELNIKSLSEELEHIKKDAKTQENKGSISDFIATLYFESILNKHHAPHGYFSENDKNITVEYIANTEVEQSIIIETFNKSINKVFHQNNIWNIQPCLIFKKEATDEN